MKKCEWPPFGKLVEISLSDHMGAYWQKAMLVKYKKAKNKKAIIGARFCDENGNKVASLKDVEFWKELP